MRNSTRIYLASLILRLLPATRLFAFKVKLLRRAGVEIGKDVRICSSAKFLIGQGRISIGDGTWIGHDVLISAGSASVVIGANCDIAPRAALICGTHLTGCKGAKGAGKAFSSDIEIQDGVWLGAASIVLAGVSIKNNSVVAAGAVVNKSIIKEGVYAGVPAKFIKEK